MSENGLEKTHASVIKDLSQITTVKSIENQSKTSVPLKLTLGRRSTRSKYLPMNKAEKSIFNKLTTKSKKRFLGSSLTYD